MMSGTQSIEELKKEISSLIKDKQALEKIISHDIRSPFNRVFALLELIKLEGEVIPSETKKYMDAMSLAVLSGLEMIRNLNDNRQLENSGLTLSLANCDFKAIVNRQVNDFADRASIKKIEIKTKFDDNEYNIVSDQHYLQRIVSNLLSNSIKYSKEGSKVDLRLKNNGSQIEFYVKDYGLGILPEEETLLFKKHAKLKASPTGGEGRTGLGLFLSKVFCDELGYRIEFIRPEHEFGSEFKLILPL